MTVIVNDNYILLQSVIAISHWGHYAMTDHIKPDAAGYTVYAARCKAIYRVDQSRPTHTKPKRNAVLTLSILKMI